MRVVGVGPHAEWFLIEVEVHGIDAPVWIARRHAKIAAGSLADIPPVVPEEALPPLINRNRPEVSEPRRI